jgi:hypothetical protein
VSSRDRAKWVHLPAFAATLPRTRASLSGREWPEEPIRPAPRGWAMQSAQPRDVGALIFVIGLFLILFVVTLTLGAPVR